MGLAVREHRQPKFPRPIAIRRYETWLSWLSFCIGAYTCTSYSEYSLQVYTYAYVYIYGHT